MIRRPISVAVHSVYGAYLLFVIASPNVSAAVILGGTVNHNLEEALTELGEPFIRRAPGVFPSPAELGFGDIIVIGNDGGRIDNPPLDYHAFLNSGGAIILAGGTNYNAWRNWTAGYFNITHTAGAWHTDGQWHSIPDHPANHYLPPNYLFADNRLTFHLLGFLPTADTTLLGANDEGIAIAAIRRYANGGSFNYMALDLGNYDRDGHDQTSFITPWLRGALDVARGIPEPGSLTLLLIAAAGISGRLFREN
jgi:hypothetical protein